MKILTVVALLLASTSAWAWEFDRNPDRFPSIGLETSTGKLAGMLKDVAPDAPHTDGGFVQGHLDLRLPVSNYVTVNLLGESTSVNNNLQFTEGHRVGVGLRVYMQ